jgi:hypothetical protein
MLIAMLGVRYRLPILPEYLTCQAYLSTVSERSYISGTYLAYFAQVPESSISGNHMTFLVFLPHI